MSNGIKSFSKALQNNFGCQILLKLLLVALPLMAVLVLSTCTIVLSSEVSGTSSGSGGVLDPMLAIFEEELLAAFDSARGAALSAARGLAGGVNSIKHGLPGTTVALVRARIREALVAQGLERSRDTEKVAPAMARASAEALADTSLVGSELTTSELASLNALSSKALAKSLNAPRVTALAEGLGTEEEKRSRLEALARAAVDNVDTLSLPSADAADCLHMVILLMTATGNSDLNPAGTGDNDPATLLEARTGALVRIAGAKLDGRLTGLACSAALNDLANAAVVGLGDTAIRDQAETKLQAVVRDGVLFNLFLAYYGFQNNVGLSAADLRGAINFSGASDALASGAYKEAVNLQVQAEVATIVPAADTKARTAAIVSSPTGISGNVTENATQATSVSSGITTRWSRGSDIHVSTSITVNGNLVIEPGVTVYMAIGANITVSSSGSITAEGTLEAPIVFTRAGSSAWGSIIVGSGGNSFAYCDISGGTDGIRLNGRATIAACVLYNNLSNGLDAQSATYDLIQTTTVRNCWFHSNGDWAVMINQNVDLDETNHFHNPAQSMPAQPSGIYNGIAWTGNLDRNRVLGIVEVPYFFGSSLTVNSPAVLTLKPGVVIKLASGVGVNLVDGSRMMAGETGDGKAPVVFTSYRDGSIAGDSVGQGVAAIPGDWNRIDVRSSGNEFRNCEFRFGTRAVDFNESYNEKGAGLFEYCTFRDNSLYGFEGSEALSGTIVRNCAFYHTGGTQLPDSYPVILNHLVDFDGTNIFHDPASAAPVVPEGFFNAIWWSGNISSNTVLGVTEVPYYVSESLSIYSPSRVDILPGVVIKMATGVSLNLSSGCRVLAGEAGEDKPKVVFTSYRDGSIRGDTSGQGVSASAGDWNRIDIRSASNEFYNCEFRYGTRAVDFNESYNENGAGLFESCIFRDNSLYGFEGSEALNGTVVRNCQFYRNGSYPVILNYYVVFDNTNIFHDSELSQPLEPAGFFNAIWWLGNINASTELSVTEVPYYFSESIRVDSLALLTIKPGVILKWASGSRLTVWEGAKVVAGSSVVASAPVIFTSYRDGSVGGDTAGQGASAAAGDWDRIDLLSSGNEFRNCVFRYGVRPVDFNESYNAVGSALIYDSIFTSNSNGGIDGTEAKAGSIISGCSFSANNADGTIIWDIDLGAAGNASVTTVGNSYDYSRPTGLP